MTDEHEHRKQLTFAQAEGAQALPHQLALGELSKRLRARLWKVLNESLLQDRQTSSMGYSAPWVGGDWRKILYDMHTLHDDEYADTFNADFGVQQNRLGLIIKHGDYIAVLEAVQFVIRHDASPARLHEWVDWALRTSQAAYRVMDRKTIVPVASSEEGRNVLQAFADLSVGEFNGARKHLQNAAEFLTSGSWSDSIRESIHAVEAVSRLLEPTANTLDPALKKLSAAGHVHPALRDGFSKLYGYTSDQQGIRHAHLSESVEVDEADALYMFGACAAFLTYLIRKGREGGLIAS